MLYFRMASSRWQDLRAFAYAAVLVALPFIPLQASAQAPLTTLRLGSSPDVTAVPILYALKSGLYKKAGINLEIVKMNSGSAVMAALVGGSVDLGKSSSFGTLIAIAKGVPITVIGNLAYWDADNPDIALIVLANSAIKSAKDLEGKTLGASALQDINALTTLEWIDQQGVDKASIKYVEIPATATLAAMEQDRIVGSTVYEPFLSTFLATGKVRILGYPYNAVGRKFSDALLFADSKWAADHRDVVQRFLQASQEASVYVAAHENETSGLIGEFGGVNPSIPIRTPGRGIVLDPLDVQRVLDMIFKLKQIPKPLLAKDVICSCALRATR